MPETQAIQTAQQSQVGTKRQQQQSRGHPTSFLVLDNQQAGPLTLRETPMKQFNPSSVASATGEKSQHNISGLSGFFRNLPSVLSYQHVDTPQPFHHLARNRLSSNHHHASTAEATSPTSASSSVSRRQTAAAVEPLHFLPISPFKDHCCQTLNGSFQDHQNLPKTINSC